MCLPYLPCGSFGCEEEGAGAANYDIFFFLRFGAPYFSRRKMKGVSGEAPAAPETVAVAKHLLATAPFEQLPEFGVLK